MIVTFEKEYLQNLYENGKATDMKHWYQPQIVKKYKKIVDMMKSAKHVLTLTQIGSLHYEKLHGDKEGLSSVRVNNQYRIEFEETKQNGEDISTICNLTELSSHYK